MFGSMKKLHQDIEESQRKLISAMRDYIDCKAILIEYQKLGSIEYLRELVKKDKENKND